MDGSSEVTLVIYFETRADAENIAESLRNESFATSIERPERGKLWKITVAGDEDRLEALSQRILQTDPAPAKVTFPEDVTTTTFPRSVDES